MNEPHYCVDSASIIKMNINDTEWEILRLVVKESAGWVEAVNVVFGYSK